MKKLKFTCFGEVLWDVFPTHKKIGGAPLNVAVRLKSFDNDVTIISKVGNDTLGDSLLRFIHNKGLSVENIQIDTTLETGKVDVCIEENGSANYDIMFPRAWDKIEITDADKSVVKSSDALIFGSLIGRSSTSKDTLLNLIELAKYKIFDVNLRPPHYTKTLLVELMQHADFIKFNDEEILEISKYLGSKYHSIEQNIAYISEYTDTKHICVTKGKDGAILLYDDLLYSNEGYPVHVKDTVGAGDSFLATLINHLLKNHNPQKAIDRACAVGAIVTQNEGANPVIKNSDIKSFINSTL